MPSPLQNVRDISAAEEVLAHSHHALMPFARPSPKTSEMLIFSEVSY